MSSKHGDEVDGYLQDFAEWAVKEDFSQDVEDWMEKHCDIFEHAELDGEQNLQFTKLHTKYVAWLESYITKFCDLNDVDEDTFYKLMEERLEDKSKDSSYLPVFLLNCDYKNFFIEMKSRANNTKTDRRAQRKARESIARTNFSGVWDPLPEKTSDKEIDNVRIYLSSGGKCKLTHTHIPTLQFMEILKIPWYIKKMWKRSMKSTMKYTIVHTTDYLEMTRKAKFFGVRTSRYPFDEVVKGIDVEADASYTFEKKGMVITDIARGKAPGSVKKRFGYVSFFSCCVCF